MSRLRIGPLFGLVVCLSGLAAVSPVANAGPPDGAQASSTATATPRLPADGKSPTYDDPALAKVVDMIRNGRRVPSGLTRVRGDLVRVEVVARPRSRVAPAIRAVGGRYVSGYLGHVLADVRVNMLRPLQERREVAAVRIPVPVGVPIDEPDPTKPVSGKVGSKGVDAANQIGATAWQAAGITGAGVKVGVIDSFNGAKWQAAVASGDLPAAPDGTFCRFNGADCSASFWNGGDHGVAVSEVIKDLAPGASLYLASVNSLADYGQVLAWFKANGVRIISRSQVSPYDGPGNGTGPLDTMVDQAVAQGMAWFNAAGNSAGSASTEGAYFRTAWNDTNADNFMDFPNGTPYLNFVCNSEGFLFLGLRWSDWGTGRTDYDLFLYDNKGDAPYASYVLDQAAGEAPIEGAGAQITGCGTSDVDYLAIKLAQTGSSTAGDNLELMFNRSFTFPWNNPFSADSPIADSGNPGMATIGAVDPVGGGGIAKYSSQGPTNDGRTKPDLSAAAGMTSVTYGNFSGTSAATPAAAGAAALVLQANPGFTPAQLVATMKSYVTDRGDAGADNVFGTGELLLPAPAAPPPPPPAAGTVAVKSGYVVPVLRSLKENFPVQVRWKVTGTQASATVWRSVNKNDFTQGVAVGSKKRARTKMVLGKSNQYAIKATDPAGSVSDWFYTRLYHPRVIDDKDPKVKYTRGWRHSRIQGAWKHTLSSSAGSLGSARLRFKGSSISLVMFRSANSGKVKVYLDGHAIGKINLRSNRVQAKRVVANLYYAKRGPHVIELEPVTTGGKGVVFLDGFLVLG